MQTVQSSEKYAGIIRGTGGQGDQAIYLVSVESTELWWGAAMESARAAGGVLPTRREWLLLLANLGAEFQNGEYWTSDEVAAGEDDAWFQYLYSSSHTPWVFNLQQLQDHKGAARRVVAIRRVNNI